MERKTERAVGELEREREKEKKREMETLKSLRVTE